MGSELCSELCGVFSATSSTADLCIGLLCALCSGPAEASAAILVMPVQNSYFPGIVFVAMRAPEIRVNLAHARSKITYFLELFDFSTATSALLLAFPSSAWRNSSFWKVVYSGKCRAVAFRSVAPRVVVLAFLTDRWVSA